MALSKKPGRGVQGSPEKKGGTGDELRNPHFIRFFLAMLGLLVVVFPFIEMIPHGIVIFSILMTVVLLSALPAVSGHHSTLVWGIILAAPVLAGRWINYWRPDLMPPEVHLGFGVLLCGFIVVRFLVYIFRASRVDADTLSATVAAYLMMGLLWTFAYQFVSQLSPDAFAFTNACVPRQGLMGFEGFYFSMATLCTVGYGDIIPATNVTRMLAIMESVTGMFYMTMVVARMVSLYSSEGQRGGGRE